MRLSNPRRDSGDADIVPLINIVFLLLIFFLIAGTLTPRSDIAVDYARTSESPVTRPPADAIYVSEAGFISYRGQQMDVDLLSTALAAEAAGEADAPLPIVLDRALPAADLSPILGAVARAGVERVRLVTLREGGAR